MSTIRFTDLLGVGADMSGNDVFYGAVTKANATTLRFSDGEHAITFTGSFSKRNGDLFGSLDGVTESVDGEVSYTAEGLDKDANVIWRFAEADDEAGAFSYLMSDGDAITGSRFADRLLGGSGGDNVRGRDGDDRIEGGKGSDRLRGENGGDRLHGDGGGDKLFGGAGTDRLDGGAGNDRLAGGEGGDVGIGGIGADVFVFASRFDFALGGDRDVIRDFSRSEGDHLDLSALDADTFSTGVQSFDFIGRQGFSETAGELRFKSGVLSGDVQGDGVADFRVDVDGVARLLDGDFIL